jgi:hypothetical protein
MDIVAKRTLPKISTSLTHKPPPSPRSLMAHYSAGKGAEIRGIGAWFATKGSSGAGFCKYIYTDTRERSVSAIAFHLYLRVSSDRFLVSYSISR